MILRIIPISILLKSICRVCYSGLTAIERYAYIFALASSIHDQKKSGAIQKMLSLHRIDRTSIFYKYLITWL